MNIVNVNNCHTLLLGRRGENEVTEVIFDFSDWAAEFGPGVIDLYAQRNGDAAAYPVLVTTDGATATWIVTATDTNVAGVGRAEYVYRIDGKIAKSVVFQTFVMEDIGQPTSTPPDPYESWLEQLTALGAETEAHAQAAEQSAENAAQSAEDAAESAASAEGYAGQAETAAGLAQAAQTASEAAETAAQAAQASAEASATAASGSAASAASSATAAAGSASSASASASAASASATTASNAATAAQAAKTAAQTAQENAETAAQSIEDSAAQIEQNRQAIADQKSVFEAHEQYAEETYAKQDGTYEDLTAGNAYELLSDRGDTNQQPYLFRQTGGDSSAYNREQLKKIVGGTVAFNQLCWAMRSTSSAKGLTFTRDADGFLTISGTVTEAFDYNYVQFTTTAMNLKRDGTKYLFLLNKPIPYDWGFGGFGGTIPANTSAGMWTNTAGGSWSNALIFRAIVGDTVDISGLKASIFDLTKMFGTAIADYIYSLEQATAGAGVAFFRSLFPDDYYDYNPGELKSVEGVSAHETVGFNQWDEENEDGYYDVANNGVKVSSSSWKCSKNFIPCIPKTSYYFMTAYTGSDSFGALIFYDANEDMISYKTSGVKNSVFTTPQGCHYIGFYAKPAWFAAGICINLSDPARNGTYEPYKKRTYPLDSSLTLRGIPKLDSNNRLYYDGDTYEPDGTVTRRYGVVDLGTLNWDYFNIAGHYRFVAYPQGIKDFNSNAKANIICSNYAVDTANNVFQNVTDKRISSNGGALLLFDSAYTDAAAFKAAMSGVMLVYELATPTTETAEPYRELEICDRDGTEEFVSTGIVPVGHETFYPVNVFDYIDQKIAALAAQIVNS